MVFQVHCSGLFLQSLIIVLRIAFQLSTDFCLNATLRPSVEKVRKEFAQKALELDPELPEAHLSLACALGGAFDWRNAQIEFDRAIELNPNLAWAYEIYAWFLGGVGRLDEAIAKDKKA